MKKPLILGVTALATYAGNTFGQSVISLDNYNSSGPLITYGSYHIPANGVSGDYGTYGTGLLYGWTVGIFYYVGTFLVSDPAGMGIPNSLFVLGTGPGSTATTYDSAFNNPGEFYSPILFSIPVSAGTTIACELVAYQTASGSYANSSIRAHSDPFFMTTSSAYSPSPSSVGNFMPAFSVALLDDYVPTPEPSTIALTGMGALGLLVTMRRKKS